MKSLSHQINEINSFIAEHDIRSISFDIDGTLYPMSAVKWRWRKVFFFSPLASLNFLIVRNKWEGRRRGNANPPILSSEVSEFENFLENLLDESLVPQEIRAWLEELKARNLDLYFLTDHGGDVKLKKLNLQGPVIDCLKESGELKPHFKIAQILREKYFLQPEKHLHLGDRWTDETQAKLLGSYFQYLKP